jgi:hypothetical protein
MSVNQTLVKLGTAGGTDINVDHSRLEHNAPVKVQLSADYVLVARPPGVPTRPSMTGAAVGSLDYPRTISSGTRLSLVKAEADALVTAGKASYV